MYRSRRSEKARRACRADEDPVPVSSPPGAWACSSRKCHRSSRSEVLPGLRSYTCAATAASWAAPLALLRGLGLVLRSAAGSPARLLALSCAVSSGASTRSPRRRGFPDACCSPTTRLKKTPSHITASTSVYAQDGSTPVSSDHSPSFYLTPRSHQEQWRVSPFRVSQLGEDPSPCRCASTARSACSALVASSRPPPRRWRSSSAAVSASVGSRSGPSPGSP